MFRMGSGVSVSSRRNIKFSAPLQAGIVECQPGGVGPQAVELLCDLQQSRSGGYREVMIVGMTARYLADAGVGPSCIPKRHGKDIEQIWDFDLYFFAGRAVGATAACCFDDVDTRYLRRGERYFHLAVGIRGASQRTESTFGTSGIAVVMAA